MRKRRTVLLKPRRNKYNAVKTVVDGITFDSKAEAARWSVLRLLEKAGAIRNLERQIKFPLEVSTPDSGPKVIGNYYADFVYWDNEKQTTVIEDVKGFKTQLYNWKKQHIEAQYGIKLVEIINGKPV